MHLNLFFRRIRIACAFGALLMVSACATLTPESHGTAQSVFNMDARMAIQYQESGAEKDSSGKLHWEEFSPPATTDITLATPFGNSIALIHLTPTQSTYKGADGSVITEATADELFYRLFGMDLPIANLHEWIGTPNQPLLKQRDVDGWHVVVTDTFDNPNLARRIEVTRTSPVAMSLFVAIENRSDEKTSPIATAPDEIIDLGQLLPSTVQPTPSKP